MKFLSIFIFSIYFLYRKIKIVTLTVIINHLFDEKQLIEVNILLIYLRYNFNS